MHPLEKLRLHNALEHTLGAGNNVKMLGTDDDVHLFIFVEAAGTAGELLVLECHQVVALHHAVDDVRLADEVGDELVDGVAVDLGRRTDLLDLARVHDHDLIGHGQRLLLVVGDEDEGDADLLLNVLELLLHLLAQLQVERAERLVEQQHARLVDERAGDGDALLLTAGELGHVAVGVVLKAYQTQHTHDLLGDNVLRLLLDGQAEGDVVVDVHVREERVFLEHGVDLALVGRDVHDILAVEEDLALGGLQEAAEDAQQRRLAAAGGTEQGDELIFVNVQADALEDDLPVLKALDDILELDQFFLFRHGSNILSLYR